MNIRRYLALRNIVAMSTSLADLKSRLRGIGWQFANIDGGVRVDDSEIRFITDGMQHRWVWTPVGQEAQEAQGKLEL